MDIESIDLDLLPAPPVKGFAPVSAPRAEPLRDTLAARANMISHIPLFNRQTIDFQAWMEGAVSFEPKTPWEE